MESIIFPGFNLWIIIKIFILAILAIYIVFAFVITRQVKVMTETLTLGYEAVVKFLSIFHLVFAIMVFIIALTVL